MLYLLHGENELQRREALAEIIEQSGLTPDFRDMNTEILEGAVSPGDLRGACSVMPFLGEARIVIARNLLSKAKGKTAQEFVAVLSDVSPTTHLVFEESKTLPKRHAIFTTRPRMPVCECGISGFPMPASFLLGFSGARGHTVGVSRAVRLDCWRRTSALIYGCSTRRSGSCFSM